jgi:predicted nucleic acid-binding protein
VRYCFDTSAINALHRDSARESIVTALLATGSVRISSYNVLEAAKTKDLVHRQSLVRLMRRLSDFKRPLDRPNTLVRAVCRAYAERTSDRPAVVSANTDPDLDGIWIALNEPEALDEDARAEVAKWSDEWEDEYDAIALGGRELFQRVLASEPSGRMPGTAFTTHSYMRQRDQIFTHLVAPIYESETGRPLSPTEFEQMMQEPVWSLYLGGYAYATHQRSVRRARYSRRKNAGGIDLGQAVYLRLCDRFITHDGPQYRALRFLSRFAHAAGFPVEVIRYDTFRHRMLPFG